MNNFSEIILDKVTVSEVLSKYGYHPNNSKRIPCMIHNGKNKNFGYTEKVYHCFVCGARGNAITLVMELFGLDFKGAVSKMNEDFDLGLKYRKMTPKERAAEKEKAINRQQEREIKEIKHREYMEVTRVYKFLSKARKERFPKNETEEPDPVFVYAVHNLREIENWLDENISS